MTQKSSTSSSFFTKILNHSKFKINFNDNSNNSSNDLDIQSASSSTTVNNDNLSPTTPATPSISINEALNIVKLDPNPSILWALVSSIDPLGYHFKLTKSNFNTILSLKHSLISDHSPHYVRIPGFHLLAAALSQHDPDPNSRVSLFVDIVSFPLPSMDIPELAARLSALYNLTKSGKEGGIYPSFPHILRQWLRKCNHALSIQRYNSPNIFSNSLDDATLNQRVYIRLIFLIEGYIKSNISQIRSANLTKLVLTSLSTLNPNLPNPIETPPILRLLQTVLSYAYVPNSAVRQVVFTLCAVVGSQSSTRPDPDSQRSWEEAGWSVLRNLLRSQCANIAAKALRDIPMDEQCPPIQVHLGALKSIRFCLDKAKEKAHDKLVRSEFGAPKTTSISFTGEEDAVNVFTPAFVAPVYQSALKRNSPLLDQEIWTFAKDWLESIDFSSHIEPEFMESSTSSLQVNLDASEEEKAQSLESLISLLEAGKDRVLNFRYPDQSIFKLYPPLPPTYSPSIHNFSVSPALNLYATILARIQFIAFKKHGMPLGLPSLLLELSSHLDESSALSLIEHQTSIGRCDPSEERWLYNLFELVQKFYLPIPASTNSVTSQNQPIPASPTVRQSIASLLFETTFEILRDVQRFRKPFLERLAVPLLEQTMAFETDPEVERMAWEFLCTVAVTEAVEEDEIDRIKRDNLNENIPNIDEEPTEIEDDVLQNHQPSRDIYPPVIGQVPLLTVDFSRISTLLRSLATLPETEPVGGIRNLAEGVSQRSSISSQSNVLTISPAEIRLPGDAPRTMMSLVSAPAISSTSSSTSPHRRTSIMPSTSRERSAGREKQSVSSSVRDLSTSRNAPTSATQSASSSPKSTTIQLPINSNQISHLSSPNKYEEISNNFIFPPSQFLSTSQIRSKAVGAVITLIQVFDKLAFSPPHSLTTNKSARAPASRRCILIIRELLNLLKPPIEQKIIEKSDSTNPIIEYIPKQSEKRISPRARLHALQFLFHLRADRDYRIFADLDLDDAIKPSATILKRVRQDLNINSDQQEERGRGRETRRSRDLDKDLEKRLHDRSRSTSRPPMSSIAANVGPSQVQTPRDILWVVPENLPFELTRSSRPAEGMVTHDPDTATDKQVPMPVSEYISTIVKILEYETDWEIVSYILCHLPIQLANKNFFSGPRAANSLRSLRNVICKGILDDKFCQFVNLPSGIRRTEVYAVAYQALTVLIAYRRLFDKGSHDEMIEAFLQGLSRYHSTARPCVHALVLCCYELQHSMVRYMGIAIQKLSQIMSAASMGSHILELLVSVGHMPTLFSNFTEADYRRVFGMTLQYIQYHNAINADPGSKPLTIAERTLSEHVLSIAYYNIYIWFLSLKLKDRSHYVPIIIRGLLVANEHSGKIDEQSEVCFDMIMRYAYSNVNPRTIKSPLSDLLISPTPNSYMKKVPGTFKQWLMGNAVISVEALDRAGWVQIIVRRPSGSTTLLSKLENFSLVGSETDLVDITTVRTALMTGSLPTSVMRTCNDPTVLRAPPLELDSEDYDGATPHLEYDPNSIEKSNDGDSKTNDNYNDNNDEKDIKNIEDEFNNAVPGIEYTTPLQELVLPEHVMLQLSMYPNNNPNGPNARLMPNNTTTDRFIRQLESNQVVDSHKIGVIFVGRGQSNESDILGNTHGSPQYVRFLSKLGHLIRLKGHNGYVGGLDKENDMDGKYAYAWWDDIDQVIFHVATLMPNHPHDTQCQIKKAHIGNDFVRIVWNGSGLPYNFNTISTDFNYINIVISPHSKGVPVHRGPKTKVPPLGVVIDEDNIDEFYRVELQQREGMPDFGPIGDFKIVSTDALPDLIRQMALFADLLAQVYVQVDLEQEFVSSWRRRLQTIKRYRDRDLPPLDAPLPAEGILGEEVSRDFSRFV